ncbi:RING-H2 finger protein ATL3 [Raphanus sativus]|nr:RING-H2 finger protein ATL3 [Raphanus sativus]
MDGDGSAHSSLFGDLTTEEVTSKIILTAVIVLFMAVLFVLILHLYAKLYWWRIDHLQQQLQQQEQEEDEPSSIAPPVVLTRRQRRRFIFAPGSKTLYPTLEGLPLSSSARCLLSFSDKTLAKKVWSVLSACLSSSKETKLGCFQSSHSTCPICRNAVLGTDQASSKGIIEQVPENVSSSDALSQISTSSSDFPTNVLVWGRQDQVSTRNTNVGSQQEEGNGNNAASQSHDALVLDINDSATRSQNVPSSSSSSMRFIAEEEEPKSPMTTRLRSLRRFSEQRQESLL